MGRKTFSENKAALKEKEREREMCVYSQMAEGGEIQIALQIRKGGIICKSKKRGIIP